MASVLAAFDLSVKTAIEDGALDEKKHGALIEAARKVAAMFDEPEWPIVRGKLDNVSPSVFLKYCEALGITPDAQAIETKKAASKLAVIVSSSRFSKAANA